MNLLPDSFLTWSPPSPISKSSISTEILKSSRHKEGLWNGLVYLQISPLHPQAALFRRSVACTLQGLSSSNDLTITEDWHISLSKPFQLSHRYIDQFLGEFQRELFGFDSICLNIDTSTLLFLPSEHESMERRVFFAFPVNSSTKINRLGKLLSIANDVLGRFGLPPFFDPPLFHISVACLPLSETTSSNIDLLEEQCRKLIGSNNFIEIIFKDIHIKIGNKIHTLPLKRGE